MSTRINISNITPEGYRTVINLDGYISAHVETDLLNLIYLRASLINGCTYCVDSHSVELCNAGLPLRKIFSVTTWRESSFFSGREKIAFELTERVTLISEGGVSDELWSRAHAEFSDEELADVILAISMINVWNRIAISTLMATPPLEDAQPLDRAQPASVSG